MTAPTRLPGPDLSPEHPGELGARFAAHDWSLTPLGPISEWQQSLRTAVSICLTSRFPILIWWGPQHTMIYNDGYRPMLGAKHPKALGSPGHEVWPEIWDVTAPLLDTVMTTGAATWSRDERLLLDRNGYLEECYFTYSHSPITTDAGDIGGVFTTVTETTEHVLSERRLGTLGVLSRRLGEATDAGHVRRLAADVLGSNPQDHPLVAMVDAHNLPDDPRDLDVPEDLRGDVLAAATEAATERRQIHRALPSPIPMSDAPDALAVDGLHALPITLPTDEAMSAVLVIGRSAHRRWDPALATYLALCITHLGTALSGIRELDSERQRAETLEALDIAKSAFFTNISHELRTPLTLISGPLAEAVADRSLTADQRERLELAQRNAVRLARMVDAMLDFGRMAASKVQPQVEPLDVTRQTRAMADSFAGAFRRAGLEFVAECPQTDRPAHLDRDMYERIVLNLLSNALKYTPAGRVTLRLEPGPDGFTVSVTDTGIGIRKRDIPRVFQRFEQLPRPGKARSHEGAGIGLAMVKQLTELMGGTVEVESALGRGSTFTIRLPWGEPPTVPVGGHSITPRHVDAFLAETEGWDLPYAAEPAPEQKVPEEVAEAPTGDRPRLLIAEDNSDMRTYLRSALSGDYDVEVVPDGTAALKRCLVSRPDLVLADAMMPGLDGFALTRAIRKDVNLRHVPVLILSARAGERDTEEGLTSGADDYVSKPFSLAELKARLGSNLERSRARLRDASWRRAVMESFQDAILITDTTGHVVEVNEAFTQLLGYSPVDGPLELPHPWWPAATDSDVGPDGMTDRERVEQATSTALRGETIDGCECRLVTRDDRDVWVRVSTRQVEGVGDQPDYVVMTMQDVTREHAARTRRQAAAELSAEFGSAADLTQVLESAVTGFAELFDGDSTVRALAGAEDHVFTAAGPVHRADLDDALWEALTTEDPEAPDPTERVAGLLISPQNHPSSECRVWVQFRRPRLVTTDERIVGDLLGQAFALAVDRVVAATSFADRESHLAKAIESHRLIGQAIGILIERHRVTPAEAFTMLKKASQDRNIKLREIAARVIETGAEPGDAD
ncbi:ATP-binding protein [Intrasporangium sp.]|uniref:ATP-binding protein n=1 Tax=Intrasporangium sp. TaxID=1925024 RepID=UPI00293A5C45|nr:ATP-binding protein [Intrasporangium sp.]MDV3220274.1 response regulator [Intrasporangium sp.]